MPHTSSDLPLVMLDVDDGDPHRPDADAIRVNHRRALWELQTVNAVSDAIAQSLDLRDVLRAALTHTCRAFRVSNAAVRLKNPVTGTFDTAAVFGSDEVRAFWTANGGPVPRPSESVISSGHAVVLNDLSTSVPTLPAETLPARSAVSVPMVVHHELIGTLSITDAAPNRFAPEDQRLLTIIAGQIGVAVQNARLHGVVRRGKHEWEQTFDAIGDPIGVFDRNGLLLRGNAALAAHLGCAVRDLPGRPCADIGFCGGGCPQCAVRRAAGESPVLQITRDDGQIFSVTTFPMAGDGEGAVVQVAKNVTAEITSARRMHVLSQELRAANDRSLSALAQLKNTQAQLLQAEKLSALGELVAGVAHELNNPLTSVIGYAQLLLEDLRDSGGVIADVGAVTQDLRRIAEESERAAKIVRNLLAFARRQSAARALHDAGDLIERTLSLREYGLRAAGVTLQRVPCDGLPPVLVDANQLQQALLNLVLNAEQAMRDVPIKRLTVGARYQAAAAAVEIFVSDTGHGIPSANLGRIFNPFFTTRAVGEGTGLGLSICYGIIHSHGGQITVDSSVGEGTTFSFLLPARLEAHGHRCILVAHAAQPEHEPVSAALEAWGYRVTTTDAPPTALEKYLEGGFDVLLLDAAAITSCVEGWRAARRDDPQRSPLIVMGEPVSREVEQFACEEASATLAPPYDLRSLRLAISAVTEETV